MLLKDEREFETAPASLNRDMPATQQSKPCPGSNPCDDFFMHRDQHRRPMYDTINVLTSNPVVLYSMKGSINEYGATNNTDNLDNLTENKRPVDAASVIRTELFTKGMGKRD